MAVFFVIPLGLEPKTHALEGRCSNPTELRNQPKSDAKVVFYFEYAKYTLLFFLYLFSGCPQI